MIFMPRHKNYKFHITMFLFISTIDLRKSPENTSLFLRLDRWIQEMNHLEMVHS